MPGDFDELNTIQKQRSVPYKEYFGEMDGLTDEQIQERIEMAERMENEVMLFLFALISVMLQFNAVNKGFIEEQVKGRYVAVAKRYTGIDGYLNDYIQNFSQEIVRATFDNIEDKYFLSADRATYVAENEAQAVFNYKEFEEAIKSGKTMKEWVDIRDSKERKTHREVGRTRIPIDEYFVVGNSLMRYAKDTRFAEPKEYVNCRCTTKYF